MATRTAEKSPDDRVSISEQAYQHLRSLIIEQELAPGTVITERRLAEKLDASRTPLRAAINRLDGEGLVERLSNGSIVIRQVSVDELMEILIVRSLLEGEAAALASQRLANEDITELTKRSREIIENPMVEFEDFWQYDDAFHRLIAVGSGKNLLSTMIQDFRDKARMCHVMRMEKNFGDQAREHLDVLEAISAGDAKVARKQMTRHISRVRSRLIRWLSGS